MWMQDLRERPASGPGEVDHLGHAAIEERIEDSVAGRVSGRLNAVLGGASGSLLRKISQATCERGDVYVIHPSEYLLNLTMDGVLRDRLTNVDVRRSRLDALPAASATFDTVFLSLQLHHEPDPVGILKEVRRVLRSDGRVVILESAAQDDIQPHAVPSNQCWPSGTMIELWLLAAGLQPTFAERTKSSLRLRGETGETSYDLVLVEAATEEIIPTQHVRTPS